MKTNSKKARAAPTKALRVIKKKTPAGRSGTSLARTDRLLHELQVHQVELEAQNQELQQAQQLLEESRNRYADLYDSAPIGYVTLDGKGRIHEINLTGAAWLGVERSRLIGLPLGLYVVRSDKRILREHLRSCSEGTCPAQSELRLATPDGRILFVELYTVPLPDATSAPLLLTAITNITERKQAEELSQAMRERFATAFATDLVGMIITRKRDGAYLEVNPGFVKITGYSPEEILGSRPEDFVFFSTEERNRIISELDGKGFVHNRELVSRNKAGQARAVLYSVAPITVDGEPCLLTVILDITDRKAAEERIMHVSTHDALTGLYNRAFFDEELARFQSSRQFPISIVMADLDHLKTVNDRRGHAAGDEHLRQAAQVFKAVFRAEDVVARIGGDEFAALLPGTNVAKAAQVLERIRSQAATFNSQRDEPRLRLSLGAATARDGESLIEVLRQADEQMYREKTLNRTRGDSKWTDTSSSREHRN